jgi:nicotinamide-nucleotide amidase
MLMEEKIARLLIRADKTLAIAESCTGGLLANRLTNIPGSSKFLKLAVVAYDTAAKIKLLKVSESIIQKSGSISEEVAVLMARGARNILKTDFGIAITGIAGPSGGSKIKPVGLTYIAVCAGVETLCLKCRFQGGRTSIKRQATTQALRLLKEFLPWP